MDDSEELRLVLTAAYLGREPRTGQPDPAALAAEVASMLPVDVTRSYTARTTAEGYNSHWRLPLPQVPAAAAGTVLMLKAHARIAAAAEHAGLGERRREGYGRFALLRPADAPQIVPSAPQPEPPPGRSTSLTRHVERRLADEHIRRRLQRAAGDAAASADRLPTPSLLGRLRVPLRHRTDGLKELARWLADATADGRDDPTRLRAAARRQLGRCRITLDGQRMTLQDWLRRLAGEERSAGVEYPEVARQVRVVDTDALTADLSAREAEHRALLADALLANLSLRARGEGGSE